MAVSAGTVKTFLDCATHPIGLIDSMKSQLTAEGMVNNSVAAGKLISSALSTLAGYYEAVAKSVTKKGDVFDSVA